MDAKILHSHDKTAQRKTLVAYSDKSGKRWGVDEVEARDTDDAELHAVEFAIRELRNKLKGFTIVCDHESVVAEINEHKRKSGRKRPILLKILDEQELNSSIKVELLENNPAHRVLNKHVKQHPQFEE